MKIRLIHNPSLEEDVVIEYRDMTPALDRMIQQLQSLEIQAELRGSIVTLQIVEIVYFESDDDYVYANTATNSYKTRYRLYELETLLPSNFMRVSKSQIVNLNHIECIERVLPSSKMLRFRNTTKTAYVSRMYYGALKHKLEERGI